VPKRRKHDDHQEIDLLTKEEVAELLRVSPRTIERLVNARELPFVKLDRAIRFHRRDVVELVNRRTQR
jgi:excisionase family DNA binding protein